MGITFFLFYRRPWIRETQMAKKSVGGIAIGALLMAIVYGAINLAALSCTDRYFHPQLFGLQFMFALYFLLGPIIGIISVKKGSQPWSLPQWHAMISGTNICLAIAALLLACYGCALQYETSEYYKDLKGSDYTATYYMWIIGSAALNVCLTIIILALSAASFNATLLRDNAVKIANRDE